MISSNQKRERLSITLSDQCIVVPGGSGDLGSVVVKALVQQGANVIILGRNRLKAKELIDQLDSFEGEVLYIKADVLDKNTLIKSKKQIMDHYGKIDALINFAGGNDPQATTSKDQTFFELEENALYKTIRVNLIGTILACQVFSKQMAKRGKGSIVNVSSMSAFQPLTKIPAYSAAKAGVENFTKWLAVHLTQEYSRDIRVNAIAPGFFLTDQNRYLLQEKDTEKLSARGKKIIENTPMKSFGNPFDLVGAISWLLSDQAKFVNGIVIPIDGGFSAYSGV